jgi:hypothetical protein
MTVRGAATRLAGAAGPVCHVRPAMFPILTIRRGCRPAFSATRASTTNESAATHPKTSVSEPPVRRVERRGFRRACRWRRGGSHLQSQCSARRNALDVDASLRAPRGSDADAWLRRDARSRDGGIREELAAGVGAQKLLMWPCVASAELSLFPCTRRQGSRDPTDDKPTLRSLTRWRGSRLAHGGIQS